MVINADANDKQPLVAYDVIVLYSATYLYLGAWVTDTGKMADVIALHHHHCTDVVNKFAIFCQANTTMPFAVKKTVFEAVVVSSMTYSSETWLTNSIKPIESCYNNMVRLLLGVRANTPIRLCLIEAGLEPFNHIVQMRRSQYLREKLNSVDMEQPFHYMFSRSRAANAAASIFMVTASQYIRQSQLSDVINDVAVNEQGSKFWNYREHLNPQLSVHPLYSSPVYIPDYIRASFSRLRLMSHSLKVETGRWSRIPREQRLCDRCDRAVVQDEEHVLITCPHTQHLRQSNDHLNFMSLENLLGEVTHLRDLANYVNEVLRAM